ncbi:MAG: cellulase family glycosylhydrolase, partial [Bacteroidota bacterium]
ANFRTVAQALVDVIRANETAVHSVVVGATGYNSIDALLGFTPLNDSDIIYTFHFYEPYAYTHQQMSWTSTSLPNRDFPIGTDADDVTTLIDAAGDWSTQHNAPVFAGEIGVSQQANSSSRCDWISTIANLLKDNSLPWFYWGAIDLSDGFGFFNNGNITVTDMDPCFGTALGLAPVALPISDLSPLRIDCKNDVTTFSWSLTTDEPAQLNIEGFHEGRKQWEIIGQQRARVEQTNYTHIYDNSGRHAYYRLRAEEVDGTVKYTDPTRNTCLGDHQWTVFPNPVAGGTFQLAAAQQPIAEVHLFDQLGRLLTHWPAVDMTAGQSEPLRLPNNLAKGTYWLRVLGAGGELHWEKLSVAY